MAVWVTQPHASGWAKVLSLELVPVLGLNTASVPAQSSRWFLNWHSTSQGKSGLGKMLTPSEIISWGYVGAVLWVTDLWQFLPCTESPCNSSSDVKHHISAWISTCRVVPPVKNPEKQASCVGIPMENVHRRVPERGWGLVAPAVALSPSGTLLWPEGKTQSAITKGFPSLGNISHS